MTDDIKQPKKAKDSQKIDDIAAANDNKNEELESLSSDEEDLKANDYSPTKANAEAQGVEVESKEVPDSGKHRKDSMIAIIVAIVIAFILVGLAFAVYLTESDSEDDSASNEAALQEDGTDLDSDATESDTEPAEPAAPIETPQEVEEEAQSLIDEIDALDDEADFGDDDLSDENLGI